MNTLTVFRLVQSQAALKAESHNASMMISVATVRLGSAWLGFSLKLRNRLVEAESRIDGFGWLTAAAADFGSSHGFSLKRKLESGW